MKKAKKKTPMTENPKFQQRVNWLKNTLKTKVLANSKTVKNNNSYCIGK
jgi:hypothetical protein